MIIDGFQAVIFWYIKFSFIDRNDVTVNREFYRCVFVINEGMLFLTYYSAGDKPEVKDTFTIALDRLAKGTLKIVPSNYDINIPKAEPDSSIKESKQQNFFSNLKTRIGI